MNGCRLGSSDDVESNGLMRVAAETFDFKVAVAAFKASPMAGDGCACPRKPSMRAFQASHASLSASFLAVAACSAFARTEALKRYSRDLVVIARIQTANWHCPQIINPLCIGTEIAYCTSWMLRSRRASAHSKAQPHAN